MNTFRFFLKALFLVAFTVALLALPIQYLVILSSNLYNIDTLEETGKKLDYKTDSMVDFILGEEKEDLK